MSAAEAVRQADERCLAAAEKVASAVRDLYQAMRILEGTPDYRRSTRGRRAGQTRAQYGTYAAFRHESIASILTDVEGLDDVDDLLRSDVRNDRRVMAAMVADEERVLAGRKEALAVAA